jgi:hypothetical protein
MGTIQQLLQLITVQAQHRIKLKFGLISVGGFILLLLVKPKLHLRTDTTLESEVNKSLQQKIHCAFYFFYLGSSR